MTIYVNAIYQIYIFFIYSIESEVNNEVTDEVSYVIA